jgi:hypothetical protein
MPSYFTSIDSLATLIEEGKMIFYFDPGGHRSRIEVITLRASLKTLRRYYSHLPHQECSVHFFSNAWLKQIIE